MSKKRKRRRPPGPGQTESDRARSGPAESAGPKRPHKEEARRIREAALRRAQRHQVMRRVLGGLAVVAVVGAGVFAIARSAGRSETNAPPREDAAAAAERGGCTGVETMTDLGREHVDPPEPIVYEQNPPTSGPHRASQLDPGTSVYTEPPDVGEAVHNLEHAYVVMWYRASGGGALPKRVVDRLASVAGSQSKVILAPYENLSEETALALTAWNRLQTCPTRVSPSDAEAIARSFVDQFRGGGEAPEPSAA